MSSASGTDRSAICRLPLQALEEICRELLVPPEQFLAKHVGCGTVAVLASTARLFHEPALNALWHTIPDIAVLFHTLPEDAYKKRHPKEKNRWPKGYLQFSFNGIPEASQFERFLSYARRVRRIDGSGTLPTRVANHSALPSAYDTLAKLLGSRVPLPSLEEIHYNCRRTASPMQLLCFLPVLFSPRLRVLRIYDHDPWTVNTHVVPTPTTKDQNGFAFMWNKLKNTAPYLQKLSICGEPFGSSSTMTAAVSSALSGLEHLVSLILRNKACALTPAALASLGRFPHLRSLRFDVGASFRTLELASLVATGDAAVATFPALRELEITASTLAQPTELLRFFESPHLQELTVTATSHVSRCDIRPLFFAITRMRAREHLRELNVWAEKICPTAPPMNHVRRLPSAMDKETLAPLLLLSGLENLSLQLSCRFDIDDEFLDLLAGSWPKLATLVFRPTGPMNWGLHETPEPTYGVTSGGPTAKEPALVMLDGDPARSWPKPRATLFGLLAFAQHCPRMRGLTIEIDADLSRVPPSRLEVCSRRGAPHGAFNWLYVGFSPIEDPYAVAAFLSDSFPGIEDMEDEWRQPPVSEYEGEARRFREGWEAVYDLIPKFSAVRLQERKWKQTRAAASKA
ncbi:uncharacterized protein TRAVEDRAFT_46575 [Trametes versicolor FP-101664 SS1]|uniref:uncharacterized protein n=1 Tax=Trametes versicolor (strain FP-101664) TaxID=717944 RepID=UPI000462186E|nr:uncharacterized protein TRAVEDRAFT_46575 [Trametes versicolor FP-101664 SS1]EIW59267.1 hypothetical protein TRAVEDRAFT_46575 [Trametes versicolor FP-101664 SS1]